MGAPRNPFHFAELLFAQELKNFIDGSETEAHPVGKVYERKLATEKKNFHGEILKQTLANACVANRLRRYEASSFHRFLSRRRGRAVGQERNRSKIRGMAKDVVVGRATDLPIRRSNRTRRLRLELEVLEPRIDWVGLAI